MDEHKPEIPKGDSQRAAEQIPPASRLSPEGKSPAGDGGHRQSETENKKDQSWPHRIQAVCAVVLIFITGFYTYYARKQAAAAIAAAEASTRASNTAVKALQDSEESFAKTLEQMRDQSGSMRTSADASVTQADAARNAVETAKNSLQSSVGQFRLDQRPWVEPVQFRLSGEPITFQDFTVDVWIQNTGKTPALDITSTSKMQFSYTEPAFPVFVGIIPFMNRGILSPGPANFYLTLSGFKPAPLDITAYENGKTNMYVQAIIFYRDIHDVRHSTKFCIYHLHGKPLDEFRYCQAGNEVDEN